MTVKGLLTQLVLWNSALILTSSLDNTLKWPPNVLCRLGEASRVLRVGVRMRALVVCPPRPDIMHRMCAGAPAERCA